MSTIDPKALMRIFAAIKPFVPKKTSHQELNNALIQSRDGKLQIAATDLDSFIFAELDCDAEISGCTVDFAVLHDYLKVEDRDLEISQDGSYICFAAQSSKSRGRYRFGGGSYQFPRIPDLGSVIGSLQVSAKLFAEHVKLAVNAMVGGKKSWSCNYDAIRLLTQGENLTIEGTNGDRYSKSPPLYAPNLLDGVWTISRSILNFLRTIGDQQITLNFFPRGVEICCEDLRAVYLCQGNEYYNIAEIEIEGFEWFDIDTAKAVQSLKSIKGDKNSVLTVLSDPFSQSVTFSDHFRTVVVDATVYCQQQVQISAKYLSPTIKNMSGDRMHFGLNFSGTIATLNASNKALSYIAVFQDEEIPIEEKLSCKMVSPPLASSVIIIPDAVSTETLNEQLNDKKEAKKRSGRNKKNKPYCIAFETTYSAKDVLYTRLGTNNALVLQALWDNGTIEWDGVEGLTRKQVYKGIRWASKKGYGIIRNGNRFTLIKPKSLANPKFI